MAQIFRKWTIQFRTFLAPVDNFAITGLMDEIAEFAAKNPELLWKPTGKVPGIITSYALALGPKGKKFLDPTALKFKKRLGRIGSIARPIFFASGLPVATTKLPRGLAFAANVASFGSMDLFMSVVFAIVNLRKSEREGKFREETATIQGEEFEGRRVQVAGKEGFFVREESSLLAEAITETADQLAFDLLPEAKQETRTRQLSIFIEGLFRGADTLVFTGLEGSDSEATGFISPT